MLQNYLKENGLAFVAMLLLAFALYFNAISFGYALDDQLVVSENKFVAQGTAGLRKIFGTESFTGYFGEQKNLVAGARYRPLSIASFAIEKQFFGLNPHVSHFINIVLYALCGFLIFVVIRKFRIGTMNVAFWNIPIICAVLFIAHPIHTEAVANIKGRDEIMALLFSLLALYFSFKDNEAPGLKWKVFAAISFLFGLLSKENTIAFLGVIPLSLYFFRNKNLSSAIFSIWPLLIATIIFFQMRHNAIGFYFFNDLKVNDIMNDPFIDMSKSQKYATIFFTIGWYFKLLFIPHPLTHDYYPYHVPKMNWSDLYTLLSLVLIIGLLILAMLKFKSKSIWSYCILFFFGTLVLVSNLLFSVGTFMNERFIFMPSLGFVLLLSYFIYQFSVNHYTKFKYLSFSCLGVIVLLYGLKTITRIPAWKDGDTLNFSAIEVSKGSARINLFTGVSYFNLYQKESDETKRYDYLRLAEKYIDEARRIIPKYSQAQNMKVGVLAEWHKKDKDAAKFFKNVIEPAKVYPDLEFLTKYIEYLKGNPANQIYLDEYNNTLYEYLKVNAYQQDFLKEKNYESALHLLGIAYKIKNNDPQLMQEIADVYTAFAKQKNIPKSKVYEYQKNADDFRRLAASSNPAYGK